MMTSKILLMTLMSALFLVPFLLYKSRKGFVAKFCLRMTALSAARKLYRLSLLITLLMFHFLYLSVHAREVGTLGSTLAFAVFFGFMDVDKWLHRLHGHRQTLCIAALSAVVFAFTPHLFTMAATLSFVLLAALFYPSHAVLSLWDDEDDRRTLIGDREFLIGHYF